MGVRKEIKGMWWLFNTPEIQIPGKLIICNDEITLETIGCFDENDPIIHLATQQNPHYDVICGISSDAKQISLFNSYESMSFNTACPFPLAKYNIQIVAVGKHFKSLEELGNYDIKAYFNELPHWFRPNCIHFDGREENKYNYIVDLNNAHLVAVPLNDKCTLKLKGEVNISHNDTGMRIEIEQISTLNFEHSVPISIRDALHQVFIFEQFLSFATLSSVYTKRLLLIDNEKKTDPTKNFTIEIYDKKGNALSKPNHFGKYLFVYETVKDTFPSIIQKWYAEKDLSPIRAHLIDSIRQKGPFCSTDFLTTAQGVEGFYCRFRKDRLSLSEIIKNLKKEFIDIKILELSDTDIKCICDSRNHYSHLLPPGKKTHVVDGLELYYLNHKLRKFLLCCILKFVGFNNDEINVIFNKSNNSCLDMISKN